MAPLRGPDNGRKQSTVRNPVPAQARHYCRTGVDSRVLEQDLKLDRAISTGQCCTSSLPTFRWLRARFPWSATRSAPACLRRTIQRMLASAEEISPQCRLALVLGHETGRRINALRQLKWSDFDRESVVIVWLAATNKQRKEHVGAINEELSRHSADPRDLLFPSPRIRDQSLGREVFGKWWAQILAKAGTPHVRGFGWHSLRRKWANEHKHHHDTEVAAAGGWNDTQTLRKCYYQTDTASIQRVASGRTPLWRFPAS